MGLFAKLATWTVKALAIRRKQGMRALARAVIHGLRFRLHNIWTRDHWWQGRIVELVGNRWTLDGIRVHLDNAAIQTRHKALFFNGVYERPERNLIRKRLAGDLPLIELGGCVGVLSCLSNSRLSDPEKHLAVEANPKLIPTLQQNRDSNRARFSVFNAAVAYSPDTVAFTEGAFTSGFVATEGAIRVPARSLESLAAEHGFGKFDLICDIEGGEVELIQREGDFLRDHVRAMLIEFHPILSGNEAVQKSKDRLSELGFELIDSERDVFWYSQRALA